MYINKLNGVIEVELENRKSKVRCPNCNKFTNSVHSKLKPIRSKYLDSCSERVNLIINKRRFHCYECNKIFDQYVLGGIEVLGDKLLKDATTIDDYINNIYNFISEYNDRYNKTISEEEILNSCMNND